MAVENLPGARLERVAPFFMGDGMKSEYRVIDLGGFDIGIVMIDANKFKEGYGSALILPQVPMPTIGDFSMQGNSQAMIEAVVFRQVPRRDDVAQYVSGPIDMLSRSVFVRRSAMLAENKNLREEMASIVTDLEWAAQTQNHGIMRSALYRNAHRLRDAATFQAPPPRKSA